MESDSDRAKTARIHSLAQAGADRAVKLGADPERAATFLGHYFRHVESADVTARDLDDLIGLVTAHYGLAVDRPPRRAVLRISTPESNRDGWSAGGATVIQIVTDDKPFLVDSVTMELLRQGWTIREVFHPQFLSRRDLTGQLDTVVTHAEGEGDPLVVPESWMHLEVLPPASTAAYDDLVADLETGLRAVLTDVDEAVEDWPRMAERVAETMSDLVRDGVDGARGAERQQAIDLLDWLGDDHFTFLGYHEYRLIDDGDGPAYQPVPGTGLGILRADQAAAGRFGALPPTAGPADLLVITKDSARATVHRAAYLDYIAIRLFDGGGVVIGERRFLGLFAAAAYADSVLHIPVLRDKVAEIVDASGYEPSSHGAMSLMAALDRYPRDELFQTRATTLVPIVEKIARLKERRQVTVFSRTDDYGRFISLLVYLPSDRYDSDVRKRMQAVLMAALGGESVDFQARVGESALARLHFVVRLRPDRPAGAEPVAQVERLLTEASRSWDDDITDQLAGRSTADRLATLSTALPEGYKADFTARQALADLEAISALAPNEGEMSMALYAPDRPNDQADLRLKVFRRGDSIVLSRVLPHLSLLGVDVLDEYPYSLDFGADGMAMIYDFGLAVPGGAQAVESQWNPAARKRFTDAFAASYTGQSEADSLNGLVTRAGLDWHEVSWLRGISRYLQQAGATYSQSYIANALISHPGLAADLVTLFRARFEPCQPGDAPPDEAQPSELPASGTDDQERDAKVTASHQQIVRALDDVVSLDADRIVRAFLAVIMGTVRTNAFQPDRPALAMKLKPAELEMLPQPRPAYEIFVCAPQVEGVHLRFGPVARGGLRWSDRPEDFRTEVLGLVKAQMVKNTVIVPVGAKGGFYPKQLPDPSDRAAWQAAGKAAYQTFISSLLDVTDNVVAGQIVPAQQLVRHDGDDAYLVVAADKGTATFSDTANAISLDRGFWLGDAFASGGSVGYDHKAMGITARGAWESVVRHFREMGIDCQNQEFTVVGIGDMSGDVFGNGMLLSEQIRLVAAFDHRHIFVDPQPDAAKSHAERKRLFDLGRSSWDDYDKSLISAGGGVFARTAKSITITEQMRSALGLAEGDDGAEGPAKGAGALTPDELINAILKAPADLLWNGGIGTYVKAETQSHAEVGDRANDGIRVNGKELRVKAVGEGGNLGLTQRGRIEYAQAGGRINTDFIDNSAGVDTSDHEVNIKILLSGEVASGRLGEQERSELLGSMTDQVADLVLAHNYDQNLALANAALYGPAMIQVHEDWIRRLERIGLLNRTLEDLPSTREMQRRRSAGEGLVGPEAATLLAYTKIAMTEEIESSDLPGDPYVAERLVQYFPDQLRSRYAEQIRRHPLARQIITTITVNRFVNSSGISAYHRLSSETGAKVADIVRAQLASRAIFQVGRYETRLRALDNKVDAGLQTRARMELRALVERGTRWLLNNRRAPIDITSVVDQFRDEVARCSAVLPQLLTGRVSARFADRRQDYLAEGLPDDLASVVAGSEVLYQFLGIVQTAQTMGRDVTEVARAHFQLGQRLDLDMLGARIDELPRDDRWATMARGTLRDDLHQLHTQLTSEAVQFDPRAEVAEAVRKWSAAQPDLDDEVATLVSICDAPAELARLSVGLRVVRSLLRTPE